MIPKLVYKDTYESIVSHIVLFIQCYQFILQHKIRNVNYL